MEHISAVNEPQRAYGIDPWAESIRIEIEGKRGFTRGEHHLSRTKLERFGFCVKSYILSGEKYAIWG